ncbi:unnamed protein product [Rotaria socialis]|uniref:Uncharacterized protein n=2 Tax=Rotaria socialis TaxID=392032 RepID=A0A820ZGJ3_9BILA|nr:unnamed protein product [Rotaria socialis]CAF3341825.1 unnamed protein product [Rotaria socialis]CAF3394043.1 unnamed protein product [Rotaria socialis]CAF3678996.1 unnamed protein product [Rotaria socialis]CAF4261085.1 unnamed protein product [Rotaria socialis]
MEEDVKNDLPSSPTSSEEEIPIPHPQNSSLDITTRSPTTLSSYSMSYPETKELNKVILPYPLRLDSNYIYRIGLKPNEFIHYCQSDQIESMFDDPMDLIDDFIQDRLRKGLDIGVHQECLNHLNYVKQIYDDNESLLYYVYEYIEVQIMKLINVPGFESVPDNQWSTILYPTVDTSTLASIDYPLNVYINRSAFKRHTNKNVNVFDLLASMQTEDVRSIRWYHGTDIDSLKKICQYGISLYSSHRFETDFGAGFYVTDNFEDAVHIAASKGARNKVLAGIICFQLTESELSQLNIRDLHDTIDNSGDPLSWSNFVKLCRSRYNEYPHKFRCDALRGPVCNNAEKVRLYENERPRAKIINNRKITQICIKSTLLSSKLEAAIFGLYIFNVEP